MRNPKLVPYETIIRATSGEPEAIDEVLRHYSKRIRIASLENGQVNKDTEDNIKRRPGGAKRRQRRGQERQQREPAK